MKHQFSPIHIVFLVFVFTVGLATVFFSGFYVNVLLSPKITGGTVFNPTPTVNLELSPIPNIEEPFTPGKQFYEDTAIFISEENPHISLVVSAGRYEKENGFLQNIRISYFDGIDWQRNLSSINKTGSDVSTDPQIKKMDYAS